MQRMQLSDAALEEIIEHLRGIVSVAQDEVDKGYGPGIGEFNKAFAWYLIIVGVARYLLEIASVMILDAKIEG